MKHLSLRGWVVITLSFIIALMLSILPLPYWAIWFRPDWVVLVLVYWALALPHRVNVGIAFLVGIFIDGLNNTLIGEHAFALVLLTYVIIKLHLRLRQFPRWQQSIAIGSLILAYHALLFWIQSLIGDAPSSWLYWVPAFTSMLLWPWIYVLLRDCRRRSQIT